MMVLMCIEIEVWKNRRDSGKETVDMREFNVTGTCVPNRHYMVDITEKLKQIETLVEKGNYFTINRARQYGKTTTFSRLSAYLKEKYCIIRLSFEGVGEKAFETEDNFVFMFKRKVERELRFQNVDDMTIQKWRRLFCVDEKDEAAFEVLGNAVTELCIDIKKPILLLIDEVDKSSDNQIFLSFLGMLRNKYLDAMDERDTTFKSVILAGVYDIKNLKLKIRQDAEKNYNSPWNIAADFKVDMSFSPDEIVTMLESYEEDYHTGMDMTAVSERIHFYTNGYPFLVSWLCKWMDEEGGREFTVRNVDMAVRELLKNDNTLFDDLIKNVENNCELADMLESMLLDGKEYGYAKSVPVINLGVRFGIFAGNNGKTTVSNLIFETYLYNHFIGKRELERGGFSTDGNRFVKGGKLDMKLIMAKFQELMKAEYREEDGKFYERQGRLLFLCFLRPIINGAGHYYIEPETRNNRRMDIVVAYGGEEFIIELKIWRGKQYREEGLKQLSEYLDSRGAAYGYLVSFNFNQNKDYSLSEIALGDDGKRAYEVTV